jgi:hypothetical protein
MATSACFRSRRSDRSARSSPRPTGNSTPRSRATSAGSPTPPPSQAERRSSFSRSRRRADAGKFRSTAAPDPRWRADGRELFFLDLDGGVQSTAIDPERARRRAPRTGCSPRTSWPSTTRRPTANDSWSYAESRIRSPLRSPCSPTGCELVEGSPGR